MLQKARQTYRDWQEGIRQIATVINTIIDGQKGEITLTVSSAATTVSDARIGADSVIMLQAITANAAGEVATTYISNVTAGEFTITHANNAVSDRTFNYKIEG